MITFLIIEALTIVTAICCLQCSNYNSNIYLLENTPGKDKIKDLIAKEKSWYLIFKYCSILCIFTIFILLLL